MLEFYLQIFNNFFGKVFFFEGCLITGIVVILTLLSLTDEP